MSQPFQQRPSLMDPKELQNRLYSLPPEIFDLVLQQLDDPADLLHLVATSKALWEREDILPRCVALDVQQVREFMYSLNPATNPEMEAFMRGEAPLPHYETILEWCIRSHQPAAKLARLFQLYEEEHPSFIRLEPWWIRALEVGNMHAFLFLRDKGHMLPGSATLDQWHLAEAVVLCPNLDIPMWIVNNGAVVQQFHIEELEQRELLEKGTPEWDFFQSHLAKPKPASPL